MTTTVLTTLRIPADLHVAAHAAAEDDGRSVNSWILQAIAEKLARTARDNRSLARAIRKIAARSGR